MKIMHLTCKDLCEFIQGCVGGYVQSDEISLLLVDYNTITTDAWFDYNLQKITSIAAARATLNFNSLINSLVGFFFDDPVKQNLWDSKRNLAIFDARAFNIPKEEVCNYFIWRQQDATRNSINMVAQSLYSHKELQGKSCNEMQEMIFQKGTNWNDFSIPEKRGSFIRRYEETTEYEDGSVVVRHPWYIDNKMPILTEDRKYIEELVYIGE